MVGRTFPSFLPMLAAKLDKLIMSLKKKIAQKR